MPKPKLNSRTIFLSSISIIIIFILVISSLLVLIPKLAQIEPTINTAKDTTAYNSFVDNFSKNFYFKTNLYFSIANLYYCNHDPICSLEIPQHLWDPLSYFTNTYQIAKSSKQDIAILSGSLTFIESYNDSNFICYVNNIYFESYIPQNITVNGKSFIIYHEHIIPAILSISWLIISYKAQFNYTLESNLYNQ